METPDTTLYLFLYHIELVENYRKSFRQAQDDTTFKLSFKL